MRIGIDARLTYYRGGGISNYIRNLVRELETLDQVNDYTVFHSRKARETITTRFRRANLFTPSHHRIERLALSAELARFRLKLLHSPDFIPPLHGAKRHVITVHDLTFLMYPEYLTPESRRYYNDQINAAVRRADHILTLSESSKRDIIELLHVPAEKVTVHLLGADARYHPLPPETLQPYREQYQLPDSYFLFVSTFEPRKNMLGLLEAYRLLIDEIPDAPCLVLVGRRGWLFEETFARFAQMGLEGRVLWRENIPDEALPAVYNMAVALIMPSFYEGFGLPALEAMACGTMPIVSNRSSLPEVVGEVGLLIEPDDPATIAAAMRRALNDQAWRIEQETAARKRAAAFTWRSAAEIALAVYNRVS